MSNVGQNFSELSLSIRLHKRMKAYFNVQYEENLYQCPVSSRISIICVHNINNSSWISLQNWKTITMLTTSLSLGKVRKKAKIRNRYNQAPHLTQDTNGKVTISQLDITYESQEVCLFPAGDHKASINRRTRKHTKNKTEITLMTHKRIAEM